MDGDNAWVVLGLVITAVIGMYTLFVNHLREHPTKEDVEKQQSISVCEQISKRIEEKLDRIIKHVERREREEE